jgi:uncharacterized protein
MKAVVIGESSGATMETIMSAIFKTREEAEEFVKEDPFILEGIVKSYVIRDWNDTMLPG